MKRLPEKYRVKIREEEKLMTLLRRAHVKHDSYSPMAEQAFGLD